MAADAPFWTRTYVFLPTERSISLFGRSQLLELAPPNRLARARDPQTPRPRPRQARGHARGAGYVRRRGRQGRRASGPPGRRRSD